MPRPHDVKIKTRVVRETDDAILVYIYQLKRPEWLPLSQVERIHRDREGEGYLVITGWIAGKLELEAEDDSPSIRPADSF